MNVSWHGKLDMKFCASEPFFFALACFFLSHQEKIAAREKIGEEDLDEVSQKENSTVSVGLVGVDS